MMVRPTTLFWCMVLIGVLPFFPRLGAKWAPPDEAFVAWSRRVILIRLLELATVLGYVAKMYLWPWDFTLSGSPQTAAAAARALAVTGLLVTGWSKIILRSNFSTTLGIKKDHQLITAGPYVRVRHPLYTGILLVFLGGALVFNSGAVLVLLAAPFTLFFYWQSAVEEKLLQDHFGEAYRRYRPRTGRFLPRLMN